MDNYKQLYEKTNEEYKEFYPLTDILSIIDKESGKNLKQLLNQYNHIKLDWKGNTVDTRNSVPLILRHKGLFVTYDNGTSIITEFYKGEDISVSINSIWQHDNNWTDLSPGASLADNEDIAEIDGKFKFADRNYNAAQFTGMGKVILRKNLIDVGGGTVKNVLTQDMINKANTIYEIRYDFDLNGEEITIPEGCVLDFQGGSFNNGIVNFNNTYLDGNIKIYSNFKGRIINDFLNILWFGAKNDGSQDISSILNKIIEGIYSIKYLFFNTELNISKTIYFPAGQYLINESIVFKNDNNINGHYSAINIVGESKGSTIIQTKTDGIQGVFKFSASNYNSIENITIVSSDWSYSSRNSGIGLLLDNWCNQIAIRNVVCRGFDIGLKATVQASSMNNIMAKDCKIGFEISSTSLTMINCYASNNKTNDGDGVGYLFHGNYCSLLNCASDSNNIAYKIVNSVNATIKGCGCEANDYGIYIDAEDTSNPFEKITIDDCSLLGVNNIVPMYINNKNMQVDIINQVLDVSQTFINYGPNANKDIINFNNCSTVRTITTQSNNKFPIIYGKNNFKKLPYDGDVYRANKELFSTVNADTTTLIEGDLYISKSNGTYTTFDINIKSLTSYTDGNLKPDINVRISVIGYSATYCMLNTRYPEGISVVATIDYDNNKLHYSVSVSKGYYTNYGHIQILGDIIANHSLSNIMNSTMNIA